MNERGGGGWNLLPPTENKWIDVKKKKTKNELLYALTVYSYNRSNCTGHNEILSNITGKKWEKNGENCYL